MSSEALHPASEPLDVVVVGAGMSGLACACVLERRGHRVRVFDKARGPGGRMSTRRAATWRFDHGAQYFTVRDPRFRRQVDAWCRGGIVARWDGTIAVLGDRAARPRDAGGPGDDSSHGGSRGEPSTRPPERFVGVPSMSAVCRDLAAGLELALETRIAGLERVGGRWRLAADGSGDLGDCDAVVVSAPPPQAAELLVDAAPAMSARASGVEMTPCWAVMAGFAEPLRTAFDAAFVHGSPLGWVARNASKPSRPAGEAWVLHATPEWSGRHLELDRQDAARRLLAAFRNATGIPGTTPIHLDAHLWRFALPGPLAEPCLFDAELRLAACGDWCGGPRVEGAFLSGCAAADRLLALHPGPLGSEGRR